SPPTLRTWRLKCWRGSRLAYLAVTLGACALGLGALAAVRGLPAFVPSVCVYVGGLLWTIPLVYQLAADLEVSWIERSLGVSHDDFLTTYDRLGWMIGGTLALA